MNFESYLIFERDYEKKRAEGLFNDVCTLRDRLARAESDTKIFTGLLEEFITMWSSLHLGEAYTRWDHRGFEALRNRTRKLIDDAAIAKSQPQVGPVPD